MYLFMKMLVWILGIFICILLTTLIQIASPQYFNNSLYPDCLTRILPWKSFHLLSVLSSNMMYHMKHVKMHYMSHEVQLRPKEENA